MKQYRIADEVVEFTAKSKETELRFEAFQTTSEESEAILSIEDNRFKAFHSQHRNLSLFQCELILSMRDFYNYLVSKGKLFMHAAVVVKNDCAYIIIAPASGGKSTLAKQIVENQLESAFVFADDRIVIGNLEKTPVVWATPWSKIINGNPSRYYVVKGLCIVQKSDICSIGRLSKEDIMAGILNEYPEECRIDVERILHKIILEKCNLLRVQSNIFDLSIEKLCEMMN